MWRTIYSFACNLRLSHCPLRSVYRSRVLFLYERDCHFLRADGRACAVSRFVICLRRPSDRLAARSRRSRLSRIYLRRDDLYLIFRLSRFRRADCACALFARSSSVRSSFFMRLRIVLRSCAAFLFRQRGAERYAVRICACSHRGGCCLSSGSASSCSALSSAGKYRLNRRFCG